MRSPWLWIAVLSLLGLVVHESGQALGWAGRGELIRTSHWADGATKETATFRGGLRHGDCERFHPDGTLRAQGRFEQGRMVGEWRFFLPDGRPDLERSGHYLHGQRVAPLASELGPTSYRPSPE